ncbi:hypothetical protein DACRYDRAFT_65406 [Dacryopinax primogenitus]|uniref:CT20-domain-containing protein n=1 Tax=Dacryopinax primogenitus (strain DJM 731) TaxID=1858805 RepID=M5GEF9_DACPD|nr:uncharacterized protein DACRYDRAFT_65406 [Dacryopinax primogenitus]EJU03208.1 hypothetical protein DACRYDRAFT_65406 [Dacryopinax primogenitus]
MDHASSDREFLDTVPGEIAFFRGIMQARPVGINRHFHMLTVQQHIKDATKRSVTVPVLWDKLHALYDLEKLENMDVSEEDESPPQMEIPLPNDDKTPNLSSPAVRKVIFHPHFREEFFLPQEEYDLLVAERRLKELPSSADESTTRPSRRNLRGKERNAGLVSGDSESSELTEGDGDQDAKADESMDDRGHPIRHGRQPTKQTRKTAQVSAKARGIPKAEHVKRRKRWTSKP